MPYFGEKELKEFFENEKDPSLLAFVKGHQNLIRSKEFKSWNLMKKFWLTLYKDEFVKMKPNLQNILVSMCEMDDSIWQELFESVTKETETTGSKKSQVLYFDRKKIAYNSMAWKLDGIDMSRKILSMRSRAIDLAQEGQRLADVYFLLLNHIVLFDRKMSILYEMGLEDNKMAMKKELARTKYRCPFYGDDTLFLCRSLLKKVVEDEEEEEEMKIFLLEEKIKAMKKKEEEKLLFLSLFESFYQKVFSASLHTEQSYIDSTLLPFFEQIFDKIAQTEHMSARGQLECSSAVSELLVPIDGSTATTTATTTATSSRKRTHASSSSCYSSWFSLFPDYLLKIVSEDTLIDVLAVEVKKPNAKSSQLVNDKAKLANVLKLMLDRLVLLGVPSPVVCGFVDDGEMITTYKMAMQQEGRYDFTELACFRGIRCLSDLMCLPSMIEHFNQLKNIVLYMQEAIRVTRLKETLPGPLSLPAPLPSAWLRPSQEYPALVSSRKKQK